MRRLVCVVEGHGEIDAAPVLCNRVLRGLLGVHDWFVDESPVRQPRSRLVDEGAPRPRRPPNQLGLSHALVLAAARSPKAILVLCDADDDCPATWGPAVPPNVPAAGGAIPVRGVMASREFESWLLWGFSDSERAGARATNPEREPRDAKKALQRLVPGYAPTTHQREQTRGLDLASVWGRSNSFDKFVRSIAELVQTRPPSRPSLAPQKPRPVAPPPADEASTAPPRKRRSKR